MGSHKRARRAHRVRHLARVAALAALGRDESLAEALRLARKSSVTLRALRETLLQVYLFAGFPRCVNAMDVMEETFGHLPPVQPETLPVGAMRRNMLRRRGLELFRMVYGETGPRVLARIGRQHIEFRDWIVIDAYGKVLSRPGIVPAERECISVALLATLDLPRQQVAHVRGALRCGATPEEVEAAIAAVEGIAPRKGISFARKRLKEESAPPSSK